MTKKIHFALFCFVALIGCSNSQNDSSTNNFINYFFQPDWFDNVKIYEYEVTFKDSTNFMYREFERIGQNKLKATIYDKDLNKTGIVTYEYLQDKIIISDLITVEYWNNNENTKETLTDNIVFKFDKMNYEFGFTHTTRTKNESNITKYVTRNLKKTTKRVFQGKDVDVVIADGKTKLVYKKNEKYPEDMTLLSTEKLIYADNIGVIYQDIKNQYYEITTNLTRIISLEDFEEIKNAR